MSLVSIKGKMECNAKNLKEKATRVKAAFFIFMLLIVQLATSVPLYGARTLSVQGIPSAMPERRWPQ